jgi:uncharacterized membrane protein YidH (DUF202 family)
VNQFTISANDIDGVPEQVWIVLLGVAVVLTVFTVVRTKRFEVVGNTRKARQSRSHIYYGVFLCVLIAIRIALRS